MKQIIKIPNAILSTPVKSVTAFTTDVKKITRDMKETLRAQVNPKGVGLAAPQIGVPLAIFVTRPTEKDVLRVFINPKISHQDTPLPQAEKNRQLEGCLSIPNVWGTVNRSTKLTLVYQDETGKKKKEEFTGFLATIIQHEMDHLAGILFTQRVLEQKNKIYQAGKDDNGKEIMEEIVI
jgi:peptide deformylase